jgi:hypothetical protein
MTVDSTHDEHSLQQLDHTHHIHNARLLLQLGMLGEGMMWDPNFGDDGSKMAPSPKAKSSRQSRALSSTTTKPMYNGLSTTYGQYALPHKPAGGVLKAAGIEPISLEAKEGLGMSLASSPV